MGPGIQNLPYSGTGVPVPILIHSETAMPHTALLRRIRSEYLEMPGMRLTLEQAQRLCGIEPALCKAVLDALVEARFLCLRPNGTYARAVDGIDVPQPRPAKADLGTRAKVAAAS